MDMNISMRDKKILLMFLGVGVFAAGYFFGYRPQMEEAQKELEEKEITATAGGGAVEVTVSGKKEITKVKLSEEVVDPDDIEMLEDLIMAATNEALRQLDEFSSSSMAKITGGMGGLGGMF